MPTQLWIAEMRDRALWSTLFTDSHSRRLVPSVYQNREAGNIEPIRAKFAICEICDSPGLNYRNTEPLMDANQTLMEER